MDRKTESRVEADRAGTALCEYLGLRFTYLSPDEWRGQIAGGRVRVNGAASAPEALLALGDMVAFDPSAIVEPEVESSIEVVMEDEDFLIVDKSGSLPCHPGGRFFEHSLWFILRERYGPVHIATRLDRETSGLVLVGKHPAAARYAQGLLESSSLSKTYMALVHGLFPERLDCRGCLIKDEASLIRKKRKFVSGLDRAEGGTMEPCATRFERVGIIDGEGGGISLVRAHPLTGRTHQIRATLFSSGFPVVGDKLYGLDEGLFLRFAAGELGPDDISRLMLPSQALHCAELSFTSPVGLRIVARSEPRWGRYISNYDSLR